MSVARILIVILLGVSACRCVNTDRIVKASFHVSRYATVIGMGACEYYRQHQRWPTDLAEIRPLFADRSDAMKDLAINWDYYKNVTFCAEGDGGLLIRIRLAEEALTAEGIAIRGDLPLNVHVTPPFREDSDIIRHFFERVTVE